MILVKLKGRQIVQLPNLDKRPSGELSMEWPSDVEYVDVDIPENGQRYRFGSSEIYKHDNGKLVQVGAGPVTFTHMSVIDRAIQITRRKR